MSEVITVRVQAVNDIHCEALRTSLVDTVNVMVNYANIRPSIQPKPNTAVPENAKENDPHNPGRVNFRFILTDVNAIFFKTFKDGEHLNFIEPVNPAFPTIYITETVYYKFLLRWQKMKIQDAMAAHNRRQWEESSKIDTNPRDVPLHHPRPNFPVAKPTLPMGPEQSQPPPNTNGPQVGAGIYGQQQPPPVSHFQQQNHQHHYPPPANINGQPPTMQGPAAYSTTQVQSQPGYVPPYPNNTLRGGATPAYPSQANGPAQGPPPPSAANGWMNSTPAYGNSGAPNPTGNYMASGPPNAASNYPAPAPPTQRLQPQYRLR